MSDQSNEETYRPRRLAIADLPMDWQTDPADDGRTIEWIRIADLGPPAQISLGLSKGGWWVRRTTVTVHEFKESDEPIFLLPILELSIRDVEFALLSGLRSRGLSDGLLDTFPMEAVVVTGLNSGSAHWSSLALQWAGSLPGSSLLDKSLEKHCSSGPTQQLRQSARKILNERQKGR